MGLNSKNDGRNGLRLLKAPARTVWATQRNRIWRKGGCIFSPRTNRQLPVSAARPPPGPIAITSILREIVDLAALAAQRRQAESSSSSLRDVHSNRRGALRMRAVSMNFFSR